tara:strand:+ start:526 stop:807 length:282 start_codon:yes stop_codon:yes gene_type:complete
MVIGLCCVKLHLPASHSLKDKRQVLRSLIRRLRNRFNVAVSEIDDQDIWQSASLGIVSIAATSQVLESCFAALEHFIESNYPVEIISFSREVL